MAGRKRKMSGKRASNICETRPVRAYAPHWPLAFAFRIWLPRLESSSPSGRHGLTQRLSDTLAASPRLRSLCLALAEAETISDPALASIAALVHRLLPAG